MKITCKKCGHVWDTKSELVLVACASCGFRNKNPNSKLKGNKNAKK